MRKNFQLLVNSSIAFFILVAISAVLFSTLVNCGNGHCYVALDKIKFFPYTDFSENIIGALNISKGDVFGVDFSQPHFPGIYIYIGLVYKIIGVSNLIPGNATASVLIYLSILITLATVYFYFSLVFGANRAWVYLLCLLVVTHGLKLFLPMSETLAFWLAIPLIYSNLLLIEGRKSKISFTDITAPILIVYFGVGYPGLLILPIVLYILIIRNNINRFPTSSSIRGSAFIVLLVILTLLICVDISKLYFWTVSINVNDVKPSLLSNIKENILSITEFKGVYSYCISIAVISILIVVQYVRGVLTSRYSIVYLILLLLSMYWRISGSYKVLPAFAVLIAIVLFSIDSIKFEKRSMFIVFSIFLMMTISYAFFGQLKDKLAYSKHEINNSEVFNMNGICKASEGMGDGCHCIQTLVFGPQFYLYNDIKQCKYQINTWSSRMGLSNEYMDIVRTSIDSGAAAFYVPTKEYVEGDLPLQEIISLIRAKYACRKLENGFELCKP